MLLKPKKKKKKIKNSALQKQKSNFLKWHFRKLNWHYQKKFRPVKMGMSLFNWSLKTSTCWQYAFIIAFWLKNRTRFLLGWLMTMTRQPEIQLAYPYLSKSTFPIRIYFSNWNEDKIKYHQGLRRVYIYNVSTPFKLIMVVLHLLCIFFSPCRGWYERLILKSC